MYNLTPKQRELLQWIVKNVKEGNLTEEFAFVRAGSGDIIFRGRGVGKVIQPIPDLSNGALRALMESGLMLVDITPNGNVLCTLLGKAYEAIGA